MQIISEALSQLTFGKTTRFQNLTLFSLLSDTKSDSSYIMLSEALNSQLVEITELTEGGSVPELLLRNKADKPILIVDGEELVGAKQNRVVNLTILAPAKASIVIPVSCVEAGRWQYRSRDFKSSDNAHYARGRAQKVASVSHSLRSRGDYVSDQHEIWDDISAKMQRMGAKSTSSAMDSIFEQNKTSLNDYVKSFQVEENQVGAVFAIGANIVGFELFDTPTTFTKIFTKLIKSYAIDAIESMDNIDDKPTIDGAKKFLEGISTAEIEEYPPVGLGVDVRLSGPNCVGSCLLVDDKVVHLVAFSIPGKNGNNSSKTRLVRSRIRAHSQIRH